MFYGAWSAYALVCHLYPHNLLGESHLICLPCIAMYCHCGLPRIPGIKLPIPSSAQGSWSQSFGADRRISADCCKEQSLRWWRDNRWHNRWQPMATDVDILYASVGQIRHGFFGCAKRQRPQQILDLANRYG